MLGVGWRAETTRQTPCEGAASREALIRYGRKFDDSPRERMRVQPEEVEAACREVSGEELEDIRKAAGNIRKFAEAQKGALKKVSKFSPVPRMFLKHDRDRKSVV